MRRLTKYAAPPMSNPPALCRTIAAKWGIAPFGDFHQDLPANRFTAFHLAPEFAPGEAG